MKTYSGYAKCIFSVLTILLCINFVNAANAKTKKIKDYVDLNYPYAIVVASSNKKFTEKDLGNAISSVQHRYYVVRVKSKNKPLYQLRYGFFESRKAAKRHQKKIKIFFNKTSVVKTTQAERNNSSRSELKPVAHVEFAEHLILSTTYEAANVLVSAAGNILSGMQPQEKKKVEKINKDVTPEKIVEKIYDHYLVLNLKTTNNLSDFNEIIKHPHIADHAFYISELKIDGRTWYQYRLGFFVNSAEARAKVATLSKEFPLARIIRVTRAEKEDAINRVRSFFAVTSADKKTGKPQPKLAAVPVNDMRDLLKKGSRALSNKKYKVAIDAFSKLLRYPENTLSMDSQEFLGFAYELNGQSAKARVEYDRYLSLYPESSGANRVRQRLASLLTARVDPRKELRKAQTQRRGAKWDHFSSFSQFYRQDRISVNEEAARESLSLLSSDVSVSSRYRGERYLMNSRFIGGHDLDFTGDENTSSGTVNSLYFNVMDIKNGIYGSIGRQNISKDGVLGRMDGAQMSYTLNDQVKLNAVTGFVVESTRESANTDKFFTGVSADLGTYLNAWDFNIYYIRQTDGSIIGREAVGSEIRYFHPRRTLFSLIDYDIKFGELNTLLAIGNWQFENRIQLNATVDIRKSPFLTTSNALLGSGLTTVDELLQTITEDEIVALAKAQTVTSKSFILGINSPLNDQYQISADVTLSNFPLQQIVGQGNQPTQPGQPPVPPAPPTLQEQQDDEYFYNLQLVGNSVFMTNDSMIVGYRYSDTNRSETSSLSLNMRFPVTRNWRLNPRIRYSARDRITNTVDPTTNVTSTTNVEETVSSIALRVDYRLKRNVNFELDFGQDITKTREATTGEVRIFFFSMGYRYDF
ncbi:hypothetical protein MNBD_GAMMA08-2044 [hydrothermal vent metagenome]|uniref:Uncharacterized protein n=1 Tax=hydrothermal vent metagenome TaxID=652676 RepID=A0A3B0X145_9ZZZZ